MAQKTFVARPLNDLKDFMSQVDIIIPYHGQYDKVTQLLESIFRLTRSNYYRVYVVDDCSPNKSYLESIQQNANKNADRLRQSRVLNTIRCDSQKGFAGACKKGYEAGESPYVCFIQSDCVIKDTGWLRALGASLLNLKEQGVRMVSPMTNNIVFGDPAQQGEPEIRDSEDVVLDASSHLSLYCFLCHRELFSHVNGFLKEYNFGGYEDEEFAFRLNHYGFKQAVCRKSWVHHEGGATLNEVMKRDPNGAGNILEVNRQRCIDDMQLLKNSKTSVS